MAESGAHSPYQTQAKALLAGGSAAHKHLALAFGALHDAYQALASGDHAAAAAHLKTVQEYRSKVGYSSASKAGVADAYLAADKARDTLKAQLPAGTKPQAPATPAVPATPALAAVHARKTAAPTTFTEFAALLKKAQGRAQATGSVEVTAPSDVQAAHKRYQAVQKHLVPVIHMHDPSALISTGRYQTIHEHGQSSGVVGDAAWRKQTEVASGLWDGKDPRHAPVYGVLGVSAGAGQVHTHDELLYGEISAELHPHALKRTTFMHGDSLMQHKPGEDARPALLNAEEAKVLHAAERGAYWGDDLEGTGYTEAQIAGGVSMKDIRAFRVHGDANADALRAKLNAAGHHDIPIYRLDANGKAVHHSGKKL